MARFADLPNELLLELFHVVWPGDLEAFANTCKVLKAMAPPFLEEHEELRFRYSKVEEPDDWDAGDSPFSSDVPVIWLVDMIEDILQKPKIGLHISEFCLGEWFEGLDSHQHDSREPYSLSEQQLLYEFLFPGRRFTLFEDALPALLLPGKISNWKKMLSNGEQHAMVGIFLLLAPNIPTVTFAKWNEGYSDLRKVIEDLRNDARPGRLQLDALQRISFKGYNSIRAEDFSDMSFYFSMRSVRTLELSCLRSGGYYSFVTPSSFSVNQLILHDCDLGDQELSILLLLSSRLDLRSL